MILAIATISHICEQETNEVRTWENRIQKKALKEGEERLTPVLI